MGLSTFVLGTAFTILPLVAAGLLAAMVLLERRDDRLATAQAGRAGRRAGRAHARHRKPGQGRRALKPAGSILRRQGN
jgi:hypothetical protein